MKVKRLDGRRVYSKWARGESIADIALKYDADFLVVENVLRRYLLPGFRMPWEGEPNAK